MTGTKMNGFERHLKATDGLGGPERPLLLAAALNATSQGASRNIEMAIELQKEVDAMEATLREMKQSIARLASDVAPRKPLGDL